MFIFKFNFLKKSNFDYTFPFFNLKIIPVFPLPQTPHCIWHRYLKVEMMFDESIFEWLIYEGEKKHY